MHLTEGFEHLLTVEAIFHVDCLLFIGQFDETFGHFASLEDQHLADACAVLERVVDHVVGQLEYDGVVDAN